ncbi:hypothetical protein FA15DRAFT_424679 [Coprinopsis marcescibilis]|uniref:Uncharacterized protein n=1 Tax=Coprinopsis marcescibilis TaxID=230819 RepID=A0A5C3L8U6_COPMA|nr:hypothetical protein FA15DRAFT_424679 [Coprinopsis marcescibilis]
MSTREHDQADRQQLDSVTVQVESVATEFSNGSTTNPAAESSSAEHQPVSMLPNTREANLNHCNVSAAKEIYHVTMNGDTRLLQGSIDELFAEMKIFKNERDRLQEENRMLQEKAQDRVRRQGVFSAPYRDNRLQEQQPQVISRREKLLRKLLCLG